MRDGERTLVVSRAALREETPSNSTIRSADKLCGTDGSTVGQRVTAHGRAPLDRQGLRETLVRSRRHVHSHCTGRRANDPQVHRLANHLPLPPVDRGSKYGLVRCWWVAIKLVLNVALLVLVLTLLRPDVAEVADRTR